MSPEFVTQTQEEASLENFVKRENRDPGQGHVGCCVWAVCGQPGSAWVPSIVVSLDEQLYLGVSPLCSLIPDLQEFALQAQLRKAFLDCVGPDSQARQSGKDVLLFW